MAGGELERAWKWRESQGLVTEACRIFHGPGEGTGVFADIAIDRFGPHAWVTLWAQSARAALSEVSEFLRARGIQSGVALLRPERGVPENPEVFFGESPHDEFAVSEGRFRILISMHETKHPGLFLDHAPLRRWLEGSARGLRVLNTFAYTGSLSLAAAAGGAAQVTTLDLSRATIEWAQKNWAFNGFSTDPAVSRFIYGDVFEWLPRLKRAGERYDVVVLDPPSFSRGKKGSFSTARDLERLHRLALELLPEGAPAWLITSINSANVSRQKYREDVDRAASSLGLKLEVEQEISLPATFPVKSSEDDYLKGWVFRVGGSSRVQGEHNE